MHLQDRLRSVREELRPEAPQPGQRADRRQGAAGFRGSEELQVRGVRAEPPVRGPRHPVTCVVGDARLEETYRRLLSGGRAALLLTDPPYCLLTRRRER